MKYVILLQGPTSTAAAHVANWVGVQRWADAAMRVIVHAGLPTPIEPGGPAMPPAYNAVIELWTDTAPAQDDFVAHWDQVHVRTSTQVIGKPSAAPVTAGVTPGLSQLSFIRAIHGLPRADVERHWDEHIPLALQIHVGMNRYVQDRLSPPDPWFGMAHLHFPHEAALRDGLFRDDRDIAVITADVAEFVAHHATMLAIEHVVKI